MIVAKQIDECKGANHSGGTPNANVWNPWTWKGKAAAETIGVFDAAMLICGRVPRRAGPLLKWAEKHPVIGTTWTSAFAALDVCLRCSRVNHTVLQLMSSGGNAHRQSVKPPTTTPVP